MYYKPISCIRKNDLVFLTCSLSLQLVTTASRTIYMIGFVLVVLDKQKRKVYANIDP